MSDNSGIEWTDATWNPTTGCTKVSPGCDHCYAEGMFNRFNGPGAFDTVTLRPDRLDQPLHWRKPRRVFVNSMSDLFHEDVPDEFIATVFGAMSVSPQHTFQVLTKRHGRMRSLLSRESFQDEVMAAACVVADSPCADVYADEHWPLPNVWGGVSVEDEKRAGIRIPALIDTPLAVRFVSAEPLLGPVKLHHLHRVGTTNEHVFPLGHVEHGIDWVIVGGESGHGARPMAAEWATSLRDECAEAGVPFFFKQAGAVLARQWGCTDPKGHNPAEWPEPFPRQFPQTPVGVVPLVAAPAGQHPAPVTRCECGKDAPFDGGAEGVCPCCSTCTTTAVGGSA